MSAPLAVDGCELEDVTGGGIVTVTSVPSDNVFAGGKGVFFGTLNVSVTGSNGGGSIGDNNGTGTGTINGTGLNVCDGSGKPALLEGDTGTAYVSGTSEEGDETVGPVPITICIKKAAQDVVIAL